MEANAWVATIAAALEAALAAAEEEVEAPSPQEDATIDRPPTPALFSEDGEASADPVPKKRMDEKGLCVVDMKPDGNCLFRSVADQVFGDPELHNQAGVVKKENIYAGGIGVAKRRYSRGWRKRCWFVVNRC